MWWVQQFRDACIHSLRTVQKFLKDVLVDSFVCPLRDPHRAKQKIYKKHKTFEYRFIVNEGVIRDSIRHIKKADEEKEEWKALSRITAATNKREKTTKSVRWKNEH